MCPRIGQKNYESITFIAKIGQCVKCSQWKLMVILLFKTFWKSEKRYCFILKIILTHLDTLLHLFNSPHLSYWVLVNFLKFNKGIGINDAPECFLDQYCLDWQDILLVKLISITFADTYSINNDSCYYQYF